MADHDFATGRVEQSQIAAEVGFGISDRIARSRQHAGEVSQLVHVAKRTKMRWQRTVDGHGTGKSSRVAPSRTNGHGSAKVATNQEDPLVVDIESLLRVRNAIGDSRFGAFDRIGCLRPVVTAVVLRAGPRSARRDGDEISHAHQRHDLPELLFIAAVAVQPD